jgi:hypothetical protein
MLCPFAQEVSGDVVGGQVGAQVQQVRPGRRGLPDLLKGDFPGGGHGVGGIWGRFTPAQQVPLAVAEQVQVCGKGSAGGIHVGPGLLQGQGQVAQGFGQLGGGRFVGLSGPFQEEGDGFGPFQLGLREVMRTWPAPPGGR